METYNIVYSIVYADVSVWFRQTLVAAHTFTKSVAGTPRRSSESEGRRCQATIRLGPCHQQLAWTDIRDRWS
jgi:hypothetical protein